MNRSLKRYLRYNQAQNFFEPNTLQQKREGIVHHYCCFFGIMNNLYLQQQPVLYQQFTQQSSYLDQTQVSTPSTLLSESPSVSSANNSSSSSSNSATTSPNSTKSCSSGSSSGINSAKLQPDTATTSSGMANESQQKRDKEAIMKYVFGFRFIWAIFELVASYKLWPNYDQCLLQISGFHLGGLLSIYIYI